MTPAVLTKPSTPDIRDTARAAVVTVTEGVVVLRADEDEFILTAGDVATIPARVSYRYWNGWDEETRVSETTGGPVGRS